MRTQFTDNNIENIDFVLCAICKQKFRQIHHRHLDIHNITFKEYKKLYPFAKTISRAQSEKIIKNNSKRILTEETKLKISKGNKGKLAGDKNPSCRSEIRAKRSISIKKSFEDPKRRLANRIALNKKMKMTGKPFTNFNITACNYFDFLNMYCGYNGNHALYHGEFIICGYHLDYYDKNLNIVIEWDEDNHYNKDGTLIEKDIRRQREIIENLNCEFYRIKQKTMDIFKVQSDMSLIKIGNLIDRADY